ncbi:MAG: efflux RND transporter periplasmic adaptor subunit [Acidobacteriota bacterium]
MATQEKRARLMRRLVGAACAVIVLTLIVLAAQPTPVPADFAVARTGALQVTLDEEGETRVRDRFVVSAPVAGRLLRIELEPGDPVIAGETVLATFQPSAPAPLDARQEQSARARVDAARAALGRARATLKTREAELAFARTSLERQERLAAQQVVATERLDQARLEKERLEESLKADDFAVKAAEHDLLAAQAQLLQATGSGDVGEPIVLFSPVDGTVLRRLRESESVVPAGEPLLEVGDSANLEIVSDYLSTDAVRIQPGQPVSIEQWGGEGPLNGRVRRVEPSGFTKISALGVEEQRVNILIDVEDPKERWQNLGDGFRVEVRVITWQQENVLLVPTSALYRIDEGWGVFVVEEGRAAARSVTLGQRSGLEAQILEGLTEGETVIVHPSDKIVDGVGVEERQS